MVNFIFIPQDMDMEIFIQVSLCKANLMGLVSINIRNQENNILVYFIFFLCIIY